MTPDGAVSPDGGVSLDGGVTGAAGSDATEGRACNPLGGVGLSFSAPGLRLALDPRLPRELQAFELEIDGATPTDEVIWLVDGRRTVSGGATLLWPVTRGAHRVTAHVLRGGIAIANLAPVDFIVK